MSEEELDALLDDAVSAMPVREPPEHFADRVMAAHRPVEGPRWWPRIIALAAAGLAAVALMWPATEDARGDVVAELRTTVTLGGRGAAVAERGAEVEWAVTRSEARVEQRAGDVFYRVDGGGPFVVHTPAGDIRALGTCFRVEVEPMVNGSHVKGAIAGAVLSAAVLVVVYEGEVSVANAHGETRLRPGESARATADRSPAQVKRLPTPSVRAAAPNPGLPPLVADAPEVPPPGQRPATPGAYATPEQEAAALRDRVDELEAALADEKAMRKETEGEAVTFPDDLPEAFTQKALLENFTNGLTELGRDFEISSVDCSEYPCIVYGDADNEDDHLFEELALTEAMAPYREKKISNHISSWGRKVVDDEGEHKRAFFGVALHPNEDDKARSQLISKRLNFRNQQAFDARRAEEGEE